MTVSALPSFRSASVRALFVAMAVLSLGACAGSPTPSTPLSTGAERPSASATAPDAQNADVFDLKVGDCLIDSSATTVSDVPTVDCGAPHDLEVFYEFDLTGSGDYPGSGSVQQTAEAGCEPSFETFVGLAYDASSLDFTEYVPTETSWNSGDRTVTCVLGDPNGTSTGTLKGAAR